MTFFLPYAFLLFTVFYNRNNNYSHHILGSCYSYAKHFICMISFNFLYIPNTNPLCSVGDFILLTGEVQSLSDLWKWSLNQGLPDDKETFLAV